MLVSLHEIFPGLSGLCGVTPRAAWPRLPRRSSHLVSAQRRILQARTKPGTDFRPPLTASCWTTFWGKSSLTHTRYTTPPPRSHHSFTLYFFTFLLIISETQFRHCSSKSFFLSLLSLCFWPPESNDEQAMPLALAFSWFHALQTKHLIFPSSTRLPLRPWWVDSVSFASLHHLLFYLFFQTFSFLSFFFLSPVFSADLSSSFTSSFSFLITTIFVVFICFFPSIPTPESYILYTLDPPLLRKAWYTHVNLAWLVSFETIGVKWLKHLVFLLSSFIQYSYRVASAQYCLQVSIGHDRVSWVLSFPRHYRKRVQQHRKEECL